MTRRQRLLAPAVTIGGLAAATLALHLRDPHEGGSWGVCPSALLGLSCPGCGGLRAVNDLTHGRWADAASSNLLLVVLLPLAVLALAVWTADRWRDRSRALPAGGTASCAAVGVVLVFTVLRNLPAGSWLAP
ncbi:MULTISPECIES: DUF2752 domain-containing protein [unclassified Nocardioides]|uniref:DUF2752 domain-containing protein n=1 Tax=unclassified Nocardioides TaxID=2615069 RepID=UPI0026656B61|nr:DUF2752 domain-containing protein [Nocardioides sp. Arc9.136]WKN50120.1 DUF2752 domain-containing protein [Nocardioides sp. Arc9.136]